MDVLDLITRGDIPVDVLISIMMKLPGISIPSLCLTNKAFSEFCRKYSERIYAQLSFRDYPVSLKEDDETYKHFYGKMLVEKGMAFYLDVYRNLCDTKLGKEATYDKSPDKIKGYINPRTFKKDITIDDLNGSFWVTYISNSSRTSLFVFKSQEDAFHNLIAHFRVLGINLNKDSLKTRFPNNYEEISLNNFTSDIFNIFKKEGKLCYYIKPDMLNVTIIQEVSF